jgi:hypothetical protein
MAPAPPDFETARAMSNLPFSSNIGLEGISPTLR